MIANNNVTSQEQFSPLVRDNPDAKRVLFFGDSWFQFPVQLIDLNKQLARRFRNTCMLNEAVPGRDGAQWKLSLPKIQREIGSYAFDAIFLSNGGNDIVGSELPEFLKKPSQVQSTGTT